MLGDLVEIVTGPREPDGCGHHWHMSLRGWVCCSCPEKVRSLADAPEHSGRCVQDTALDPLQEWLWELVEPATAPRIGGKRHLRVVRDGAA